MPRCLGACFEVVVEEAVRNRSAVDVAEEFGREKRTVLTWVTKYDCPHTMGVRRGHASPSFNYDEVARWLTSKGMPLRRKIANEQRAKGPNEEGIPNAKHDANPGGLPFDEPDTGLGERGELDFDSMIEKYKQAARRLFDGLEKDAPADPNAKKQISGSMGDVSRELRMLEEARFNVQKRRAEWVPRVEAVRVMAELTAMFVVDLQGLGAELPARVVGAVGAAIPETEADAAARRVAVTIREAVDRVRERRAEVLKRCVGQVHEAAMAA